MRILLEKSNIDFNSLRRMIHKVAAVELSELSVPCYYPSLKKYYYEFLHVCKLKEVDVKEFVNRFYKGTPAAKWKLHKDPISNLYIFLMFVLLQRREVTTYKSMMIFFVIRNYTNLIHKQIQFCNKDVFRYTLEHLAKTHLFSREKTISGAIQFMAKEMYKKYTAGIKDSNVDIIAKFITECRTRVSQSVKSFAEAYYAASKEGSAIREPYEGEDEEQQYQQLEKTSRVVIDVVRKITVYKVIDQKAINEARQLTKIRVSLATGIAGNIRDVKYADDIRTILELFIRELTSAASLCGKDYYIHVRKLMSVKRTKALVYFKQQVGILLEKVVKELKIEKEFFSLTKQTQSLVNLYLAYYLTMVLRNTVC